MTCWITEAIGILSLVLQGGFMSNMFWSLHNFLKCVKACVGNFLYFSKTEKNRSSLTSRLAVVSRLDLLYVSENSRLSIPYKHPRGATMAAAMAATEELSD